MCVTIDHKAGKQTVFVNGEYVDEKLVEDYKIEALQKKINKTFSPKDPHVTDVFLGCWPFSSWWNAGWGCLPMQTGLIEF